MSFCITFTKSSLQNDEMIQNFITRHSIPPSNLKGASDERIITAAVVTTGEKSDGHYLQELVEKSKEAGIEIETVIGDAAYSGKENLAYAKSEELQLVSKLNTVITNGNGQRKIEFDYNKDAGMFVCPAGHMAIRKARTGKKNDNKNQSLRFYFDVEKCKVCLMRVG